MPLYFQLGPHNSALRTPTKDKSTVDQKADHETYSGTKAIMLNLIPVCNTITFSSVTRTHQHPRTLPNLVASNDARDAIERTPSHSHIRPKRNPNSLAKDKRKNTCQQQNQLTLLLGPRPGISCGSVQSSYSKEVVRWLAAY
jgi:hypothetical protein